jgi:peptide/nickel transport system substrate-binding protein
MSKRQRYVEGHEPDCPAANALHLQLTGRPVDRRMVLRGAMIGAGVLAVPAAAACSSSSSSGQAAPTASGAASFGGSHKSTKDTLTIAASETPASIDWDLYLDPVSFQSYNNVYNTPLTWKKVPVTGTPNMVTSDFRNLVGRFAEDWEFSKDGTSLTLKFKKGVMSHAGHELGAKDFYYTRARSLGIGQVGTFLLHTAGILALKDMKIVDKYTIKWTSATGPNPLMAAANTNVFFNLFDSTEMKKHATGADPWSENWLKTHSAGFGPYKLVSIASGTGMTWARHDQYFGGAAPIETIIYKEVPEASNRLALVSTGAVDLAQDLSPRQLNSLKGNSSVTVYNSPDTTFNFISLNEAHSPLNNLKVRQALSYAYPYDKVVNNVYFGLQSRCTAPVPSLVPGYGNVTPYNTDLTKAKSLLQSAGQGSGLTLSLLYDLADSDVEQSAILYQQNLKQIGVNLTFDRQPTAVVAERYTKKQFQLVQRSDGPIQADLNYGLGLFYLSANAQRQCCNYVGFASAHIDELITKGAQIFDPAKRLAFNKAIMPLLMDQAPFIYVTNVGFHVATAANLRGMNYESPDSVLYQNLYFT